MRRFIVSLLIITVVIFSLFPLSIYAAEEETEAGDEESSDVTGFDDHLVTMASESGMSVVDVPQDGYRLGELYNADNTGYSENDPIDGEDYHFGWELGHFYVSGYSRAPDDTRNDNVFLKNPGDEMKLYFVLDVDIDDCTPSGRSISISEDDNGYDENFGVGEVGFGRGAVIIKYTDPLQQSPDPIVYTNFLTSCHSGMATLVDLFQEGDYEVTLDYELKVKYKTRLGRTKYHYPNYKITFSFKVRNGNCMMYLFDSETNAELANGSFTPNGFVLNLANSKYLQTSAERFVLNEGANGLVQDTRFNKPVRDGTVITEEGIYEITVTNLYTGAKTTKKIYVGSNLVLMAHVVTGYDIDQINYLLSQGATINADGTIFEATPTPSPTPIPTPTPISEMLPAEISSENSESTTNNADDTLITDESSTDSEVISNSNEDEEKRAESKKSNGNGTTIIIIVVAAVAVVASFVWTNYRVAQIKKAAQDPIVFPVSSRNRTDNPLEVDNESRHEDEESIDSLPENDKK